MANSSYKQPKEEIKSEPDKGVFDRSRKKSSRSKADLFELLLVKDLSKFYNLTYSYLNNEINDLINKILTFSDGPNRIKEQKKRIKILSPFLIKEIDKLIPSIGKPVEISWVGRKWKFNKTLSDINIKFSSGKSIGVSTKSTRTGRGTQKNIGQDSLKKILGLNIENELMVMNNKIKEELFNSGDNLKKIAEKGMGFIRKNKYRYPVIQNIGKKFGTEIQKIAVKKSVECFNNLPDQNKKNFIIYILGLDEKNPLISFFAIGNKSEIYWNKSSNQIINSNLKAKQEGDKGYVILSNDIKVLRIQANFTNGIGISPFCERAFLLIHIF